MKPLERVFFQACIMSSRLILSDHTIIDRGMTVREITNVFYSLGFPIKRLWRYLEKWAGKGFYNYGVTLDLGWFEEENLTGEYKVMYDKILEESARYGRN